MGPAQFLARSLRAASRLPRRLMSTKKISFAKFTRSMERKREFSFRSLHMSAARRGQRHGNRIRWGYPSQTISSQNTTDGLRMNESIPPPTEEFKTVPDLAGTTELRSEDAQGHSSGEKEAAAVAS